jgi:hypothetical protein
MVLVLLHVAMHCVEHAFTSGLREQAKGCHHVRRPFIQQEIR